MEPHDLHAPGQRFGEVGEQQDVRGPGKQEAAGCPPPVHGHLDGLEQLRRALDLVEDDALGQAGNETRGISARAVARHRIVEADVGVVPVPVCHADSDGSTGYRREPAACGDHYRGASVLGQRGLAALAWAVDQDNRRVVQRLDQPGLDVAWVECRLRHRLIVRFMLG